MDGFKQGAQIPAGVTEHGQRMGFKHGGMVKSDPQFLMKTEKQDDMDHAKYPRRAKDAADQRTKEMGNRTPVEPRFKRGGKAAAHGNKYGADRHKQHADDLSKDRRRTAKAMPKNVKKKGGKARKPYTGYNEQEGGSGNEDKRYMGAKKGGKMKKRHGGVVNKKGFEEQKGPMPAGVKKRGGRMKAAHGGAGRYAEGGLAAAQKVMKQHIRADKPEGHGVKKAGGGRTMNYGKGGYKGGGRKAHRGTPMYGGGRS